MLTIAVVSTIGLAIGPTGVAGAGQAFPHLHRVRASTKEVRAGGTFTIVAHARYRVVEDYEVIFTFDLTKVDLPDETCDDRNGPQNADNPSCEYDNGFLPKTTTIGYFLSHPTRRNHLGHDVRTDPADRSALHCKVRRIRITESS